MEIKICEKCQSMNTSEDLSTNKITCLKCGHISVGTVIDFFGTTDKEKLVTPIGRQNPFTIQTKIRNTKNII